MTGDELAAMIEEAEKARGGNRFLAMCDVLAPYLTAAGSVKAVDMAQVGQDAPETQVEVPAEATQEAAPELAEAATGEGAPAPEAAAAEDSDKLDEEGKATA